MSVSIDGAGSLIGVDQGLNIVGLTTLTGGITLDDSISHIGDTDTKIRFPAADTFTVETAGTERLRIDSSGRLITGNYSTALDTTAGAITINGGTNGGRIAQRGSGSSANTTLGEMFGFWDTNKVAGFQFTGGSDTSNKDDGQIKFYTSSSGPNVTERLRISSNGTIILGTPTSTVLKAEVCNSVSGHQFISQCSDNNNGFEVYQQHGSNTTRNNFAVYANTGSGNAKDLQFSVRGDGCVTKPNNPAFLAGRTGGNETFTLGTFPFNVARINVGNCWNTSTYKFTAPVAGIYYFFASVYYNDGAGQHRIHFRKTPNGGTAFQLNTVSHQASSNDHSKSIGIMESMAVGDTVELYSDQNAAVQCYYNMNNTTYGAHTYIMGYLIG